MAEKMAKPALPLQIFHRAMQISQSTTQKNTRGWDIAVFGFIEARVSKRTRPTFSPKWGEKVAG